MSKKYWVVSRSDLKSVLDVMTEVITNIGDTLNRIIKVSVSGNKFLIFEGVRGSSYIKQYLRLGNESESGDVIYYIDLYDLVNLVNNIESDDVVIDVSDGMKVSYMDGYYHFDTFDIDNEYNGIQMDLGVSTRGYTKVGEFDVGAIPYSRLLKVMGVAEKVKSRSMSIINGNAYVSFGFMFLRVKNVDFVDMRFSHQMLKTLSVLNSGSPISVFEKGTSEDFETYIMFRWGEDYRNYVIFNREDIETETQLIMDSSLSGAEFFSVDLDKVKKLVSLFAPQSDNVSRVQFKKSKDVLYMHTYSRHGIESKFKISGDAICDQPIDFGINVYILGKIVSVGMETMALVNKDDTRFFKLDDDVELLL